MQRQEDLWETINIQQKIFLGPHEYLLTEFLWVNSLKVKMKVLKVQGALSTS
jgi:hypothetical protein